jgi:2,3-bisphosphoglycerate-independent phosphoglycerate mutase
MGPNAVFDLLPGLALKNQWAVDLSGMKILFIFLDGVGLGNDDPDINPFIRAVMPTMDHLLEGNKIIAKDHHNSIDNRLILVNTEDASLIALDACLGVDGMPQSASGQASLMTGKNVSAILGFHDGPKPNPEIIDIIEQGSLFSHLNRGVYRSTLLNAYPPRYFESLETGYKLPGVIALSAKLAGIQLKTLEDLYRREAISADFTAQGWRDRLGFDDAPLLTLNQAGERLYALSSGYDLALFEYWITDIAGHQQDMQSAYDILEMFDTVLGSLVRSWNRKEGLILITSDHGNLEDLSTRRHTRNEVPLLLIGAQTLREQFFAELERAKGMREKFNLADIHPAIIRWLGNFK